MKKKQEKRTWFELILYVFSFIFQRLKYNKDKKNENKAKEDQRFNQHKTKIKEKYKEIDQIKEENKKRIEDSDINETSNILNKRF
jgi:hypothetical protein